MTPLAIVLYAGLHGWEEGLVSEGWRCVGFDIVDMCRELGHPRPENTSLVIQDVLTLHGSQFRNASLIVASPPCQEPSYRAMPWKAAKAEVPEVLPDWWTKAESQMTKEEFEAWSKWRHEHPCKPPENFMRLFDACFRIQREASEAAGRYIPLIVENVRGAQKWVGGAKAVFGSFFLWGDVRQVGNKIVPFDCHFGDTRFLIVPKRKSGEDAGFKTIGMNWSNRALRGQDFTRIAGKQRREHIKQGGDWWDQECRKVSNARFGSKSPERKESSALIAKIPFTLAQHIGTVFHPEKQGRS